MFHEKFFPDLISGCQCIRRVMLTYSKSDVNVSTSDVSLSLLINIMRSVINLLTIHVKKITIQVKNMQLLNQLRKNMTNFDKLYEHFEIYTQIVNQIKLRSQCWKDQLQIDINKIEERITYWCDVCEAWKDEKFR